MPPAWNEQSNYLASFEHPYRRNDVLKKLQIATPLSHLSSLSHNRCHVQLMHDQIPSPLSPLSSVKISLISLTLTFMYVCMYAFQSRNSTLQLPGILKYSARSNEPIIEL